MTKLLKPSDGSKPIWGRSGTLVGALLVALKGVAPDTPWWGFLILAGVTVVAEQIFRPSVNRKDLPT